MNRIEQNLQEVRGRIADAAARASRQAERITLVGVTKYVGTEEIRRLVEAGCRDLGESRPQQLWQRAEDLASQSLRWHLIGHLQRNKVRRTLAVGALIQSVDSLALAEAVDRIAAELGLRAKVLLEVNISGEEAKHGLAPDEVAPLLESIARCAHISVLGLMAMAGLEGGLDAARRQFAALRELRDRLAARCPPGIGLTELSMGMSGDYEVAIEEGATIVRVGSALFAGGGP